MYDIFHSQTSRTHVSSTSFYGGYLWRSTSARGHFGRPVLGLTYTLESILGGWGRFGALVLIFLTSLLLCGICLRRNVEINSHFHESGVMHSLS